jgi:hypothetical protein
MDHEDVRQVVKSQGLPPALLFLGIAEVMATIEQIQGEQAFPKAA